VAPGGPPTDSWGLAERYFSAARGERQGGGSTRETSAHDADIRRYGTLKAGIVGDLIDRRRVVRACMFLSLIGCLHGKVLDK
jgi:hypothetical protein